MPEDSSRLVGRIAGTSLGFALDTIAFVTRRSKTLSVERIDGFSAFDADSLDACRASHATTYAYRDVPTLNWLYFGTPNRQTDSERCWSRDPAIGSSAIWP